MRLSLIAGSNKRNSIKELRTDAINTIAEAGIYEYAIYTDGLAESGLTNGGSAAIATTGPASEPTLVHSSSKKGNKLTSSFETEVMALQLATEWLAEQGDGGFTIICSNSPAALSALSGSCISDGKGLAVVRSNLAQSNRRILLQWVLGHFGLIGNEWTYAAAGEAATTVTPNQVHQQAITYKTAKALIGRELVDPPTTHERTKAVFEGPRDQEPLSRGDAVLIAQLRSGHAGNSLPTGA